MPGDLFLLENSKPVENYKYTAFQTVNRPVLNSKLTLKISLRVVQAQNQRPLSAPPPHGELKNKRV